MKGKMKELDLMTTNKLVDLFLDKEQRTMTLLKKQKANISKAINQIIKRIAIGGRVIYIGAGTSGRLGILDAVECKPTFSTNSFVPIIAGGESAVFKAKEGTEDSTSQAIKDLKKIKLTKKDIVIGISASGETLYTVSAIKYSKKQKITTISITSNPKSTLSKISDYKIYPKIDSELISGSSRLSSGTAQKIILNLLSSIPMIKTGKVFNNLMIDVQPANKKLIKRAIGIISSICEISLNKASILFKQAKKDTKAAIIMHFKGCNLNKAKELFRRSKHDLRNIIS